MNKDAPNNPPTWIKIKPPAKLGPVTLLKEGAFALPDGQRFSASMTLSCFKLPDGSIVSLAENILTIQRDNGSELRARFETGSWFATKGFQTAPRLEVGASDALSSPEFPPQNPDEWPALPSCPDTWQRSSCRNSSSYSGALPPSTAVSIKHRANALVRELRRLRMPDDIRWSSDAPPASDRFRLLVMRPHQADTVILTKITCLIMGEVCTVQIDSDVVLGGLYSHPSRFTVRFITLLIWLLTGALALLLVHMVKIPPLPLVIGIGVCGFPLLVVFTRYHVRCDPGLSIICECLAVATFLIVGLNFGSTIVQGRNDPYANIGSLRVSAQAFYVDYLFLLPAASMLFIAWRRRPKDIDCFDDWPADGMFVGRHQAIIRCVTETLVG